MINYQCFFSVTCVRCVPVIRNFDPLAFPGSMQLKKSFMIYSASEWHSKMAGRQRQKIPIKRGFSYQFGSVPYHSKHHDTKVCCCCCCCHCMRPPKCTINNSKTMSIHETNVVCSYIRALIFHYSYTVHLIGFLNKCETISLAANRKIYHAFPVVYTLTNNNNKYRKKNKKSCRIL